MLSNIGNSLIILCILLSFFLLFSSFECLKKEVKQIPYKIFYYSLFQSTFSIVCFFILITGFIISDFSLINVFQNSHTAKPLFYKISGTWGNHEGSLLLWINILVIFSYLFLTSNKNSNIKYRIYTLISQNILIIGFFLFLLVNSNPFALIVPTPKEGLGLNPILQDPALAIHPPLLYIGFVGSSIFFSAAIGSLLSNYTGQSFAKSIKPWVIISWVFQTLGITVGSIWAYYELGWGGFWFWDPVENASLMPWFVMTALMHSVIVLEKRNTLYSWVIILCLLTFILSVTGTFLVRSGILNSVHTFANDPSRGLYILIFLSLMIFSSLTIFFNRQKEKESYNFSSNSKETFLLLNNWFMAFYLATVLIGTVYPIFTETLSDIKISVGPPFYNMVIIPIIAPFLLLMALAPKAKWIKNKFKSSTKVILTFLAAIFINILITYYFKSYSVLTNLIIISSIFLIIYSLLDLFNSFKKNNYDLSRIISHLGFGLLVFFIGINHTFTVEKDFNLKKGEVKNFENFNINFKSLKIEEEKNYKAVIGEFSITNKKDSSNQMLYPEIRIYKQPETLTYESSIKSKFSHDLYLTMSNINQSEFYNIKFQKKPFMLWIWMSAILISLGGFIRIFRNEN